LVVYKCNECGAEIITAESTVATTCAYCGRAITLSNKMVGNFKPDYVIPFSISEEKAKEIYKKYCNSTFLTPKHFKKENEIKKMKGIYAPFWLHSFTNDSSAMLLCENTTTKRQGDDKVIIKHKYNVNIDATGKFDKIPTDALKNLNNSLMDAIEPFDYEHMKDFNPAYMAGYYAEEYNESDKETKTRALDRAETAMKQEMIENAGKYEKKAIVSYNDKIMKYNSDYVMLPVWLFNIEYKGKKYTFAINGDTGKITGKLPVSFTKVLLASGITFIFAQIIALIIRLFA
jgi:DNA-directed RNA polymerase subunit RPC12/RpoP